MSIRINSHKTSYNTDSTYIANKVTSKLSDGDIKGAIRLLCSDDTIAPNNLETLLSLQDKHPSPFTDALPNLGDLNTPSLVVKEEQVHTAIFSFPNGSAGGLDSLRPQILKDLLASHTVESGTQLLKSLTQFSNFILEGRVTPDFTPFLYGASLTALLKKSGGIRPIAVGNTCRRLVAKLACTWLSSHLADYFRPIQIGFAVRNGAEAGAHAARKYFTHFTHKQKHF